MLGYLEYINQFCNIPIGLIVAVIVFFAISNLIGEILEFKGKIVPEIFKIRKYFARKKQERETLAKMPEMMGNVEKLINDVEKRYNEDDIKRRDKWMDNVNQRLDNNDTAVEELKAEIKQNSADIVELRKDIVQLLVENKRDTIINFAEKVSDNDFPVTREQFTRIDRIYQEYEKIIKERNVPNGEIEIAHKIIEESYQTRLKNHSFVEDVRWHGLELG